MWHYREIQLGQKPKGEVKEYIENGIRLLGVEDVKSTYVGRGSDPKRIIYYVGDAIAEHTVTRRYLHHSSLCNEPRCSVCNMPVNGIERAIHFSRNKWTMGMRSIYAHDECVWKVFVGESSGRVRKAKREAKCQVCNTKMKDVVIAPTETEWPFNVGLCERCYIELPIIAPSVELIQQYISQMNGAPETKEVQNAFKTYRKMVDMKHATNIAFADEFDYRENTIYLPECKDFDSWDMREVAIGRLLSPKLQALARAVKFYELVTVLCYVVGKNELYHLVDKEKVVQSLRSYSNPVMLRQAKELGVEM